ncbi:hypothetical protein EMCRGX_G019061 [Ephydatia muelleri]
MTPLSDWLNVLPRGSGIAGVTELPKDAVLSPYHPLPAVAAAELPPPPAVAAELPPPPAAAAAAELPPAAAELPPAAAAAAAAAALPPPPPAAELPPSPPAAAAAELPPPPAAEAALPPLLPAEAAGAPLPAPPHHRHQYWHQCPQHPSPAATLAAATPPAWLSWPEPGCRGYDELIINQRQKEDVEFGLLLNDVRTECMAQYSGSDYSDTI